VAVDLLFVQFGICPFPYFVDRWRLEYLLQQSSALTRLAEPKKPHCVSSPNSTSRLIASALDGMPGCFARHWSILSNHASDTRI
jgi:hypothetical protein